MKKSPILICLLLAVMLLSGCTESAPAAPEQIMAMFYQDGETLSLPLESPATQGILRAAAALLTEAESTYRLVASEQLIEEIQGGPLLEITYPQVQQVTVAFNQQQLFYTHLYFPLAGDHAGAVFYRGAYARELPAEPAYAQVDKLLGALLNEDSLTRLSNLLTLP